MTTYAYGRWWAGAATLAVLAAVVVSCGGTGGGGGQKGSPDDQFFLNSNNAGRLVLNVDPTSVDANKSDRLGLVATLTDSIGNPVRGALIVFSSDVDDITFIPNQTNTAGQDFGSAVTDAQGNADVIAVAGSSPTGTGAIVGTAALFAEAPPAFGLLAQAQVTLLDVGFIDADALAVIPSSIDLVEPQPGQVLFFNIVGGTPPYLLKNESSGLGAALISQHCGPGCTENGGDIDGLCIGSPCQSDEDCNEGGSPAPADVCLGPIKRCLASCAGTNCGGSRCDTDEDCNDGASAPANVCEDSGQSIAYIIGSNPSAGASGDDNSSTHTFIVEDSAGGNVSVTVTVSFICGNGVASGAEQCDLGDISDATCTSFGLAAGCTKGDVLTAFCLELGIDTPATSMADCNDCSLELTCEGTSSSPMPTSTP